MSTLAGEHSGRPLLPQTTQMQTFSFAPVTTAPQPQRNYVFVDEHNRHKRLKVMRACEGCRRRKIKCDAATTNTWPCAACTRLKLTCVPPTISYESDSSTTPGVHTFELNTPRSYSVGQAPSPEEFKRPPPIRQLSHDAMPHYQHSAPNYATSAAMYAGPPYVPQPQAPGMMQYNHLPQPTMQTQEPRYQQPDPYYNVQPVRQQSPSGSAGSWQSSNQAPLTEAMGDLKIGPEAVAPWITNQKALAEAPAVEELEIQLPQSTSHDLTIRIPPEMMPSEAQALQYFEYFFSHINPYVPVIHRSVFYQQWQSNRDSISPLLLEGIFACAAFMLDEQTQGNKWLALAAKHEESFKDVPRLSTIQAIILVLKARESSPKRGYYYRSWMTVVNLVAMAKDLELHEHFENHQMGIPCNSSASECLIKTRVWQTLFTLEINVGGAQGRFDFGVRQETVDFGVPMSLPGIDDVELQTSRQFAYFLRVTKNISDTNALLGRLRKKRKDWAIDLEYIAHNKDFVSWNRELPADLQVILPEDGTLPWIPSHVVANLHVYHYLALIMHHRPQMLTLSAMHDPSWKQHMAICYNAAKNMCRLQEAVLRDCGMAGLVCMQRGVSFSIYCILTCNMLHLAAITSPDAEFNSDARDYFVRHMRILERCIPSWPMAETVKQINALREAFSADITKPFALKRNFPYGSPVMGEQTPYRDNQAPSHEQPLQHAGQVHYNMNPITPPMSSASDTKTDSPVVQSMVMMGPGQGQPQPAMSVNNPGPTQWNPTRIFDQWNAAFGTPPTKSSNQSSPSLRPPPTGQIGMQEALVQQQAYPSHDMSQHQTPYQSMPPQGPQLPAPVVGYAQPTAEPYVTPSMWQDVVASSFPDGGLKRRWNDYGPLNNSIAKRAR